MKICVKYDTVPLRSKCFFEKLVQYRVLLFIAFGQFHVIDITLL